MGLSPTELGYAEITADVSQVGIGNKDVPGLSLPVTVGARPIIVRVKAVAFANTSASGITYVNLMEGSTRLGRQPLSVTAISQALDIERRLTPTPGVHTYFVNLQQLLAGNSTIFADDGTSYAPAFIQVLQI